VLNVLRFVVILILVFAAVCRGENVVSGRWEGTARIPGSELNVIVDLAEENGAWVGSIIIPGLDVKGALLTDIAVRPPDVSFAVKGPLGVRLKLRLDANSKMTGDFEQPETGRRRRWTRRVGHRSSVRRGAQP